MRKVLVTGIGRPGQVGEVVTQLFADAGDHLLLVDRELGTSRERAAALEAAGASASAYAADLADPAAVEQLALEVGEAHGRVDALIHLAGGWQPGAKVADSTAEQWSRILAINLMTAVNTARSFAPLVRAARGAFVFVASEAALPGATVAGMAAYATAKQGVVTLMRALAAEERAHGVRANALAPAAIRTATNERSMGADIAYVEREAVADTVLWLCSPAATAVTGQVIQLVPSATVRSR
ncbi:MAG: SDR family oxidoreductase [Gemmatimonadaceae bacterium]|nr:SDR family oxidoreductase [Gemmatimonadaceae bacterium]